MVEPITSKRGSGFTLLELMISLTIIAIMVVLLFGSMRVGVRAWEKGERDLEFRLKDRVVLDLIKRQLASLLIREQKDQERDAFFQVKGDESSLRAVSCVPILGSNEYGVVFFKYLVGEEDGQKKLELFEKNLVLLDHEEDPDKIGLKETESLISGLSKIFFSYLRRDKEGNEEWVSEWDPEREKSFPAAFKVVMRRGDQDVPMAAVARVEVLPEEKGSEKVSGTGRNPEGGPKTERFTIKRDIRRDSGNTQRDRKSKLR